MGPRWKANKLAISRDTTVTKGKSRGCRGGLGRVWEDIRRGKTVGNADRCYVEHRRGELFTPLRLIRRSPET